MSRRVRLTLIGVTVLVLGSWALALAAVDRQGVSTDLLAAVAILGGLAIIINALPDGDD